MFDELKILITGDTSGIESSIKQAVKIVQGGVEKMNDETVDWTGIFSRAVSPAIISGVASMFAFAIAQNVQFQASMATTGVAAGETSGQIAQMGKQALGLSTTLPQSAQDIAKAMTQVSAIFGTNSKATQDVTQLIGELASSGFGDLNDITKASTDIFRMWGVTTEEQAVKVLTDLMHGAQGAKESIPDLANQFMQFSPQLVNSGMQLKDFNNIMSAFSAEVANLGVDQAVAAFNLLGQSAEKPTGPLELAGVSLAKIKKSLVDDGGITALNQLSTIFGSRWGNDTTLIANALGLSDQQIASIINHGRDFPKIASDTRSIATNAQGIADAFRESDNALRDLMTDWNKIKESFINNSFWSSFGSSISKVGGFIADVITHANDGLSKLADMQKEILSGSIIHSDPLNKALTATGVGFSDDSLKRIDQTAGSTSMMDSLLSALQTGIKGGQYTSLVNTFHLTVPPGSQGLTAKQIATQLYNQFQGTQ